MPTPTPLLLLPLLLLLSLLSTQPTAIHAQSVSIAFSENPPSPYTPYDKGRVTPSTFVAYPSSQTPVQYSNQIRARPVLTYSHVLSNGLYSVRIGLMEIGASACMDGARVFTVSVNGDTSLPLDIYKLARGCNKPYDVVFNQVSVSSSILTIVLTRVSGYAPMLSHFQTTLLTAVTPTPTSSPTTDTRPPAVNIAVNLGTDPSIPGTFRTFTRRTIENSLSGVPDVALSTARAGTNFSYSFVVPAGSYQVILAVVETLPTACEAGFRVFSVFVNDIAYIEGYDIFAQVGACLRARKLIIPSISISSLDPKPLVVRFQAVSYFAQVAYLNIRSATRNDECVPESDGGELSDDHSAHAVPGSYPPQTDSDSPLSYVDHDGDGFVRVFINGEASHTHFSDPSISLLGRLTKFEWTLVDTGEVISTSEKFRYNFPLGSTRIRLTVVDNSCDQDNAETTVTVTGTMQPGQYCYFYPGTPTLTASNLQLDPTPSMSSVYSSLDLPFPTSLSDLFVTRCVFFLDRVGEPRAMDVSVDVADNGHAVVYRGTDAILDTRVFDSVEAFLPTGLSSFEIIHHHNGTTGVLPKLRFLVNNEVPRNALVKHDQSTVLPILTAISPDNGQVGGGTRVKFIGYGLYLPQMVSFGSKSVRVLSSGASRIQFFVNSPAVTSPGAVRVSTTSSAGVASNELIFQYGATSCDDVAFENSRMQYTSGSTLKPVDFLPLATAIALGPDARLYIASLRGVVDVVGYNPTTLHATTHCSSPVITDPRFNRVPGEAAERVMLGIAFNPLERRTRPYVSLSTRQWHKKPRIERSNAAAWRNGVVERLKWTENPGRFKIGQRSGICLGRDKTIVSNLPVSNRDHLINGLLFTQDGDLLIAVGGNTNSGLPGYNMGNAWETPLSAAIVVAKLSQPGYDGEITYSTDVHYLARQTGGDVETYATGFRNVFALTMTYDASIYAADNGPNCRYGHVSIGCDDFDAGRAAGYAISNPNDWQGRYKFPGESSDCEYGPKRDDKVMLVLKDKFYGHANLNRDVAGECAWIDPNDGETANGNSAPGNYESPMRMMPSSVTGIGQYRAAHFCGRLRGELLMSRHKGGKVYRMKTSGRNVESGPDLISQQGGFQFVEDMHGNVIFSQYFENEVIIFKPKISMSVAMRVSSVHPWRMRRAGGTRLFVGGDNFEKDAQVFVDDVRCENAAKDIKKRFIRCTMPPWRSGRPALVDVRVVSAGVEVLLPRAVLYMNR